MLQHLVKQLIVRVCRTRGLELCPSTRTLVTLHFGTELLYFARLFQQINGLTGDIVECGVDRGWSFLELALLMQNDLTFRHLWGFDSFAGYPVPSPQDGPTVHLAGTYCHATVLDVIQRLREAQFSMEFIRNRTTLTPGFFDDTLPHAAVQRIAFLHVDCQLYSSTRTILTHLLPKMVPGGIVAFNEYARTEDLLDCPGTKQAIDEYCVAHGVTLVRDTQISKYHLVAAR